MKRFISLILVFTMILALVACSNEKTASKQLTKEGVAPYELLENEKYLLESFGIDGNSQIISFNAPKNAITLNVNVYRLENDENWKSIGDGSISIGKERESMEQLTGIFTMQLKENYAIDLNINASGRYSFKTDEIILDTEAMASVKQFLENFQEVEINKEIPVALMIYDSGTSMKSYSLQDYFNPSEFAGMDLVQAVTLTFSDKEISL